VFAAIVAPVKVTLFVPAVAVTVPPQLLVAEGEGALTKLPLYVSVKPTVVIATSLLLVMVTVKRVTALITPELGLNALATVGLASTLVLSVTLLLLALLLGSPPPATLAVLAMLALAVAATFTVTVITGKLAPTAKGVAKL
jgi:hypothetical protein